MTTRTHALILDFGEVLTRPQPPAVLAEMARLAGVAEPAFVEAYWTHRLDYDGGLAAEAYWARVFASCGAAPPNGGWPALLPRLYDADAASWMDYREPMWDVAVDFRARGGLTAMLSNGVPEVMARVRADRALDRWFDVVVVSYELGVVKPSRGIYDTCLARLGVAAEEALFVDDRPPNIDAADRLGLETLLFRGDASVGELRARLDLS